MKVLVASGGGGRSCVYVPALIWVSLALDLESFVGSGMPWGSHQSLCQQQPTPFGIGSDWTGRNGSLCNSSFPHDPGKWLAPAGAALEGREAVKEPI